MQQYPYERYQFYFTWVIRKYGIRKENYAWQECEEATYMAYLYSIYRCAASDYSYVDFYVRKMGKIFVYWALVISSIDMKRTSWDETTERIRNKH